MLKGIPKIMSPELLKILCEMGHGDEIVIADGNFPSVSHAQRLIRMDGHSTGEVLDAVLKLIKLDGYVERPVALMDIVNGDDVVPVIWDDYSSIIKAYENDVKIDKLERFEFYERAKKAYAIIATGESALYANVILKKGVICEE